MQRLIDRIEAAGFQCDAGPLATSQDWLLLKAELAMEGHLKADPPREEKDWRDFDRTLTPKQDIHHFEPQATEPQDELYDQAVQIVLDTATNLTNGIVSISAIQRRLRIGYNRSYRLVEAMERNGLVTAADDSGRRKVVGIEPKEPQPCSCKQA